MTITALARNAGADCVETACGETTVSLPRRSERRSMRSEVDASPSGRFSLAVWPLRQAATEEVPSSENERM